MHQPNSTVKLQVRFLSVKQAMIKDKAFQERFADSWIKGMMKRLAGFRYASDRGFRSPPPIFNCYGGSIGRITQQPFCAIFTKKEASLMLSDLSSCHGNETQPLTVVLLGLRENMALRIDLQLLVHMDRGTVSPRLWRTFMCSTCHK